MFPAHFQTFICLFVLCFSQLAAQISSDDPPTSSTNLSPSDPSSNLPENRYPRASESNNFHLLHQQIAPLSRVMNAYHIENCLLTRKCNSDEIITELVNVADVKLLKTLGNVKTSKISSAILLIESFPHAFSIAQIEKIQESANKMADIEAKWKKMTVFEMPKDLATHSDNIDELKSIDLESLVLKNPDMSLKKLDAVLALPKSVKSKADLQKAQKVLREATTELDDIVQFINSVVNIPQTFAKFTKKPEFLTGISHWNTFLNEYTDEAGVIEDFKTVLQTTEPDLTTMQQFVTQNSNDTSVISDVESFRDFTVELQTSRNLPNRTHTPALPRGAQDLNLAFDDVTSDWIQKALGKKKDELWSSLQPINDFAKLVMNMGSELYVVGVRGLSLKNIETVAEVFADMEKFKKLPAFAQLLMEVLSILDQQPEVLEAEDEHFAEIYTGYDALVKHSTSLSDKLGQAAKTKNIESLSDLTDLQSKLNAEGVTDNTDMSDMISELINDAKLKTVISVVKELKTQMPDIKSSTVSLTDALKVFASFHDEIDKTSNRILESSKELTRFFDSQKSKSTSFQSLLNGIPSVMSLARKIQDIATSPSFYKDTYSILSDMDAAIGSYSSLQTLIQTFPKDLENRIKSTNEFDDVRKASALGEVSKLLEKLSEVFEKLPHLNTVSKNCDLIGEEIGKLKNSKVASEITKDWRDSKKLKVAMESLNAAVLQVNKGLSTDLKSMGNSLSKIQNVEPNLDFAVLLRAVALLDSIVSNPKVTEVMAALAQLASLDLSFSSHTSSISQSADLLTKLASHDSSTSANPENASTTPDSFESPWWAEAWLLFLLAGIDILLCIAWCSCLIYRRDEEPENKPLLLLSEEGQIAKDLEKLECSTQTHPMPSQTQGTIATPILTGKNSDYGSPPSPNINKKLKDQLAETQNDLARLRAHVKKETAQHKSDTRSNKFKKKGPISIPREPDVPPGATNLPDNLILENVQYDPSGNETFDIGSDVDDIEMDSSVVLDVPTSRDSTEDNAKPENSKEPNASKKKAKSKGRKSSGKSKDSGKQK